MKPKAIKISILVGLFFVFFAGPLYAESYSTMQGYTLLPEPSILTLPVDIELWITKSKRSVTFAWNDREGGGIYMTIDFELKTIRYSSYIMDKIGKISFSELSVQQKARLDTVSNLLSKLSDDNNLEDWNDKGSDDVFVAMYYENGLLKNRFIINDADPLKKAMSSGEAKRQTRLKKQYEDRDLDEQTQNAFLQLYDSLTKQLPKTLMPDKIQKPYYRVD
jgi:hypothetical protein